MTVGVKWINNHVDETLYYSGYKEYKKLKDSITLWCIAPALRLSDDGPAQYLFITHSDSSGRTYANGQVWGHCYYFKPGTPFKEAIEQGRALADMLAAVGEFDLTENSEGNHRE